MKFPLLFNIFCALFSLAVAVSDVPVPTNRIRNGYEINIRDAPYYVNLHKTSLGREVCGGTIIKRKFILTAAHCVTKDLAAHKYYIKAGVTNFMTDNGVYRKVKKIFVHPQFGPRMDWDFALIYLYKPLEFNEFVKAAPYPKDNSFVVPVGAEVKFSGFGYLDRNKTRPNNLQQVALKVSDSVKCAEKYEKANYTLNPNLIVCAQPENGKDVCFGDSGGPMIYRGRLVGVISMTSCGGTYPVVNGKVAEINNWIKQSMHEANLKP